MSSFLHPSAGSMFPVSPVVGAGGFEPPYSEFALSMRHTANKGRIS